MVSSTRQYANLFHFRVQLEGFSPWVFIKQDEKCLFLCEDGYFELYESSKHGNFVDGIKV